MARIAGVDIPRNKRVEIALTYIYGIGKPTSQKILKEAGINFDTRVKDLTEEEINQKAVDYFTELLKSEKKLEFTETNIQVQMKKISGKWNILNTDDIYTAIAGNPVTVEIVP